MSDHGQPMGEGEHGHGIMRKCRPWPYEELVHVPLIMHVPGIEGGRRIKSFVQNVDVTATIMDALGELGTPQKASDFAIAGYYGMSWSLITEDYSYVHWLVSEDVKDSVDCIAGSGTEMKEEMWTCTAGAKVQVPDHDELYDRRADPFQLNNIAEQNPDKAREMLQQLKLVIGEIRTS